MPGWRLNSALGSTRFRRSGGKMSGELIYAIIFMACFVLIGGVVMFLSKTIDHGEARFDSEGKVINETSEGPTLNEAKPAQRIDEDGKS